MPFGLFSSLNPRATNSAMQTGTVPKVKRNCMVSGGISREPSLESKAHPPQQSAHAMEYQNQRALSVPFDIIQKYSFPRLQNVTNNVISRSLSRISRLSRYI